MEYMEVLFGIVFLYVLSYFFYVRGRKKGKKEINMELYRDGYDNGIKTIEKEVFDLSKEKDSEILKRIKNFAENYSNGSNDSNV